MACKCAFRELVEVEWAVPTLLSKECVENVCLALEEIAAVRGVKANLESKTVTVCFDDSTIGLHQLKESMSLAGYPADFAGISARA
jgi:copper chaperone CopZ